jgi:glycosyltransferase involved in cell wall biosynthesis
MNISVAMCTYNGSRFLQAQLKTIGNQTRLPFELIVCDDGSTDATPEIVQAFAQSVTFPVHFIRNAVNLRSTKNFEKAIRLCQGEIIALCDQDDLWAPEKLRTMADILEREPEVAGVFSDAALIDDNGARMGGTLWGSVRFAAREQRAFHADQAFFLIHRPAVTGAAFLFRSRFVNDILPIAPEWVHDAWIALILASLSKLKPVPALLISYRLHASQQLGVKTISKRAALRKGKQDRIAFHRSNALQLSLMADKLATLPVHQKTAKYARAKARYMNKRATLLEGGRLPRIFQGMAVLRGHFRFGWGLVSYFRDLLHA